MKTLIIGGTGTIGKELVSLCELKGDEVISASRKSATSIDIEDSSSLDNYFSKSPFLDAIICVAGNASFGKLADMSEDQIRVGMDSKLLGQVNLVKKGIQRLNPGGTILITGGMLAYSPWPETSNIAMVNAGLEGFVKALALELEEDKSVKIVHPPLIKETAEAMGMDSSIWPSAHVVAETYLSSLVEKSNGTSVFVKGYGPK